MKPLACDARKIGPPYLLSFSLIFLLTLFLLLPQAYGQETNQEPQEYGVKAVYLYNFLQFVNWPEGRCRFAGKRIKEIAVIGDSPIGASLQALKAELQRIHGAEITIRFLGPYVEGMDLGGCRLLFISRSEMKNIQKILAGVRDKAVLTVADSEECLDHGCMIALLSRMNKVRWAINREQADQEGLRLNSRLLAMAVKVIGQ